MKLQHLAIIFIIIILPISMVITSYIQTQIDTIALQRTYSSKLQTATYDAIRSFQLNTINNKYSTISDSKIRDIEASISTFYNSLGTELGASGYDAESLKAFIPAMLYTMYDGYYIYGKYYNDVIKDYQYGLKPYIYYSCRYKQGNSDFVVNYTLDNTITVYGIVNGIYETRSGALINPELVNHINDKEINGKRYAISLNYDGIEIGREILTEQLILLDDNNNPISTKAETYEYISYNNRKVYKDANGYFWNNMNKKQYITDEETLNFVRSMTENGRLWSNSAVQYYAEACEFSKWVNDNLNGITQENAVDSDGKQITDFSIHTQNEPIFVLSNKNNPLVSSSTFNQNRISVIRKSIESNLASAIANYSSTANYEFAMPKFTEEDWDRLVNNISVATFMQGIPIGSKYFNKYCIMTNNKNKEVVTADSIYIITANNQLHQLHLPTCKEMAEGDTIAIAGYKNIDFERQTVVKTEGDEVYFYPHAEEKCYSCMVSIAQTYDIDELIQGTKSIKNSTLRKIYLTALAREKYDLYKTNAYFGI